MINIFLAVLLTTCCFQLFTISYRYSGINKAIVNTPLEIFATSIPLIKDSNLNVLYFSKEELKTNYLDYIDKTLNKYTNSYFVDFYFYLLDNHDECFGDNSCKGVEITIDADVYLTFKYHRTMFYEISEGKNG